MSALIAPSPPHVSLFANDRRCLCSMATQLICHRRRCSSVVDWRTVEWGRGGWGL